MRKHCETRSKNRSFSDTSIFFIKHVYVSKMIAIDVDQYNRTTPMIYTITLAMVLNTSYQLSAKNLNGFKLADIKTYNSFKMTDIQVSISRVTTVLK